MTDETLPRQSDRIDAAGACRLIGGDESPIDKSTLYRGIAAGRYPAGFHVSPNVVRWSHTKVEAAIQKLAEEQVPADPS
jgi:hypothetical protein